MGSFYNNFLVLYTPFWLLLLFLGAWTDVSGVFAIGANAADERVTGEKKRNLIVNGESVNPSAYPFFVHSWHDSLSETSNVLCGASLIHADMILTAAHCHGAFNFGAMTYEPKNQEFKRYKTVDLQIAYEEYYRDINLVNYDLMVMRLDSPIDDVTPVTLNADPDFPTRRKQKGNQAPTYPFDLEAIGIGLTETGNVSPGLKAGSFSPLTVAQCAQRIQGSVSNAYIAEDVLCADPTLDSSICLGDSGGPLITKADGSITKAEGSIWADSRNQPITNTISPIQVGITSFGNDCQSDMIPDGFVRVSYFADWIKLQICRHSRVPPPECSEYRASDDFQSYQAELDPNSTIPEDNARITLDFQHDFLAEETVFVIRNVLKGTVEYVGPQYVPRRGERVSSNFFLPVPGNYVIEIYDSGGDGLTNPDFINPNYTPGAWTLHAEYRDGRRLEYLVTGDSFESLYVSQFRLPKDISPWSESPIDELSVFPTLPENNTLFPEVDGCSSVPVLSYVWGVMGIALAWGFSTM